MKKLLLAAFALMAITTQLLPITGITETQFNKDVAYVTRKSVLEVKLAVLKGAAASAKQLGFDEKSQKLKVQVDEIKDELNDLKNEHEKNIRKDK